MALTLLWRDELLHTVGEEYATHLVVVLCGGECQHGGNLGDYVLLHTLCRAEASRRTHIHQEHHRQLTLLLIDLDVGLRRTRCHVPVNVTHIIAYAVLSHLGKRHTASAESSVILSCEDLVRESSGLDLYLADSAKDIVLALLHKVMVRLRC